ncbi:aminotransferase [Fusarium oxysporum f. sp. vasinfectum]|nr:aminotransferase [Fusarium oxysporum f. sp. vasinfectum]
MVRASTITAPVRNPQLRMLNALHTNRKPIMTFLGLPSLRTAQIVASTGVDAVIIDCEHGHISDDSMHDATAAIAAAGVSPLVRLRMTHPDLIKRALDSGAHGIILPQVNTAEEASEVVKYSKFPPQGLRGQGSPFAGFAHNVDIATYVKTANETTIVCVQIESRQGVDNVDAICAVPGVDMVFIGPNDLAFSLLGYVPAKGDEPEFLDAIDKIVAAARKHGNRPGYVPDKVDLGVGIYRNESGLYSQLGSVAKAKTILAENDPGHDYEITIGNQRFLNYAASLLFGQDCELLQSGSIASVQTISGTGANHLAALALSQSISPRPQVYIGTPTWGNYKPMFELAGLEVIEYPYFDFQTRTIDFSSIISAALTAPPRSVFILQACCHNPTGADPTREQWQELGAVLKEYCHFVFFDIAYQGLGNGIEEDAYAIRHFATLGLDMFVCQSFSKNFALYGERCGALHAVCSSPETAAVVQDRLRCLIRWEFSSSPAYGSRLATLVLESDQLTTEWVEELCVMQHRLKHLRKQLHHRLTQVLKTPGDWNHILRENGLFSYLDLSTQQCQKLIDQHHIYLPPSGRINISGLNQSNIKRVADSLDEVIHEEMGQGIQTRAAL